MQNSLNILSDRELTLFKEAKSIEGTIEHKSSEIERLDIYNKYKVVHSEYFDLYNYSTEDRIKNEALKRLIFLNWYVQVEPSIYTGLGDLDREIMYNSFVQLNSLINKGLLDFEFHWMLSYYSCWEWTILDFCKNGLENLKDFVITVDQSVSSIPREILQKDSMYNRGQMGLYWQSYIDGHQ